MKAWVNGEFLPEEQVRVSLLSHSFSRGSAIFETFDVTETARGPALFRPDAHVERFINSAEALHVPLPAGKEELIDILKTAVRTNSMSSGGVKLFAYYSEPEFRLIPKERSAKLAVFCFELSGIFGEGCGESTKPLTAGMSTIRKSSPSFLPVHAKACGLYVGGFLALSEAVEQGYDDVIMLDELGFVAEGAVKNVFFVKDGAVITPKLRNVLPGITRNSVIEVARGLDLPLAETDVTPEQALASDEAFYTGTHIRVCPIRSIDGKEIGAACPGPVTGNIRAALNNAYAGRDERYESWLTYIG